jgi:hypothetical protein
MISCSVMANLSIILTTFMINFWCGSVIYVKIQSRYVHLFFRSFIQILTSLVQFLSSRYRIVHNEIFYFAGLWKGVIITSKIFNPSMSISFWDSLFLWSYVSGGWSCSNVQNLIGKSRVPKGKSACLFNAYGNPDTCSFMMLPIWCALI